MANLINNMEYIARAETDQKTQLIANHQVNGYTTWVPLASTLALGKTFCQPFLDELLVYPQGLGIL